MSGDDDAERRIRELERPLADAAEISELGTGTAPGAYPPPPGYYPPPPPPGASFPGSSYPGLNPKPSRRLRVGWIAFAVIILALMLGGVAIVAHQFTSTTRTLTNPSTKPSVSGGGGSFTTRPTTRSSAPSNETSPESPAPPVDTESVPPADGNISVAGMGQKRTFTCNDSAVSISGVSNTVVLQGHCARVDVSGVENIVTVDSADAIVASGMHNRVTFHSGSPDVSQSGFSNSIDQG